MSYRKSASAKDLGASKPAKAPHLPTSHILVIGDSRRMSELADSSVHLIITSPPYWQLKDYGDARQIGFHDTYEEYINNLSLVWSECVRVLHPGCRMCINIGDQFARSAYYGRYKVIPIRTEIIKSCEALGMDYMGAVIWQKVTTCKTTGGAVIMGSYPYPRNGIIKIDYEFILVFKKPGKPPKPSPAAKKASRLTNEEWNEYFYGHWNFPGEKQSAHLAAFPLELPKRLIKMYSFVGDTVLDPFVGSGTTMLAAKMLGRCSAGYEMNEEFLPIIEERMLGDAGAGSKGAGRSNRDAAAGTLEVKRQQKTALESKDAINSLPYVFKDPTRFDKKVDPRKKNYGQKVRKE